MPSAYIGQQIAERLLTIDKVAYLRFASVHQDFQALEDFIEKARDVADKAAKEAPGQQRLFQ